jgi:hypothetical protein
MNPITESPLAQCELVVSETNALQIIDPKDRELIATLKPLAESIPLAVDFAHRCVVNNAEQAEGAAKFRETIITTSKQAEDALRKFDDNLMDRLFKTHRRWTALLAAFSAPLDGAAKTIKSKIIVWQNAEAEKAAREQARLQAEADERARQERARLEKEAARLKTPELKQERLEAAQSVVAPVVSVAPPPAAVKVQRRWAIKSIDRNVFLSAAATQPQLQGFVAIEESKLIRSKAANSAMECPGIVFHQVTC